MNYNSILITGGAGFVGSNLAVLFKQKYPRIRIIALDNLKRRGSELNLARLKEHEIEFLHGDIRNSEDLELKGKIDLLIECSAEPSVLAGYNENPGYIINTNLCGAINCFELARKNKADVVFLSTSRVYAYDELNDIKFTETATRFEWAKKQKAAGWTLNGLKTDFSTEGPKSMYGATKLCCEVLLREYARMYGVRAIINRCGVIAGPWQFGKADQGIFTFWMLAHYFKKPVKYIGFGGRGKQVRDLMHVNDLFALLDRQIAHISKASGRIYNAGGGRFANLSLLETTCLCEKITGNKLTILSDRNDRPADVRIYISDNGQASDDFGWKPQIPREKILEDIFGWIRSHERKITSTII